MTRHRDESRQSCKQGLNCVLQFVPDPLLVFIEYVPYGDLLGYLRKSRGLNDTYFNDPDVKPRTNLTSQQLMQFAWQIADGMNYLSSSKVSLGYVNFVPVTNHPYNIKLIKSHK